MIERFDTFWIGVAIGMVVTFALIGLAILFGAIIYRFREDRSQPFELGENQ